jgi:hypothetical protein
MSLNFLPDRHPQGHYPKWPEVTWDIAEERYLQGRSAILTGNCAGCLWQDFAMVLNTPERLLVAEVVMTLAHAYSCDYEPRFFPLVVGRGPTPGVSEEDL